MQKPAVKKGAQDSAATEEAALRLGDGTWPVLRSLRLGSEVVRRNPASFAATGAMGLAAFLGFMMIPRGAAPGPEAMATALALLAALAHGFAIERTQRDLLGAGDRSPGEAAIDWCLRVPALVGVVLLVGATVTLLDMVLTPMLRSYTPVAIFLGADLLVRSTGFLLHEVVAGERNPLRAMARSARLAGFPLRAVAARGAQWMALGSAAWGLGIGLAMLGGGLGEISRTAGLSYAARDTLQALTACIVVPLGIMATLYWTSWVQASWAAYHLLRKEETSCDA